MKKYHVIWGIAFGALLIVILGAIIYSATGSENNGTVLKTIRNLDARNVSEIVITPQNPLLQINLTVDTITVYDKAKINEVITALKVLKEKHVTKGADRFWESNLVLSFDTLNNTGLKNKDKIGLKVYNTNEGLFVELIETMGYKTYACPQLQPLLEKLAHYKPPPGRP